MIALLRRQPLVWYFVLAFAWTWAFVIVFLILAAKNNEVAPLIAFAVLATILVVATRGRLGYSGPELALAAQPAFSAR